MHLALSPKVPLIFVKVKTACSALRIKSRTSSPHWFTTRCGLHGISDPVQAVLNMSSDFGRQLSLHMHINYTNYISPISAPNPQIRQSTLHDSSSTDLKQGRFTFNKSVSVLKGIKQTQSLFGSHYLVLYKRWMAMLIPTLK
jgi:hypothetical protein